MFCLVKIIWIIDNRLSGHPDEAFFCLKAVVKATRFPQ